MVFRYLRVVKRIITMQKEELQQHLSYILSNISSVKALTDTIGYDEFTREEQIKEEVYSHLQEIGEIAYEIENAINEPLDVGFDISVLSSFKTATYNQDAEIDHHGVFTIIQHDFPTIEDDIRDSKEYKLLEENEL